MDIKVSGCHDCPCCDMMDMAIGYLCRIVGHPNNEIEENPKTFQPITPDWCPIKKEGKIILKWEQ